MQDNFKKNYILNLAYQVLAIIVPLITTPYISRVLGPSTLGDYAYTASIVSYFGIVAVLGTATYAQREIAYIQNDKHRRSVLFYEIFLLRLILTGAMLVFYVFICIAPGENLRVLYIVQLCTVFSWAFDTYWFFLSIENFAIVVARDICVKLVSVILIFTCVKSTRDINIYVLIVCGTILVGNLCIWPFISTYTEKVSRKELKPFSHFKGCFALFIPSIAYQLYSFVDQTMLGRLINNTEVGYYEQSQKIIRLVCALIAALASVLLPRMSSIIGEGKLEEANKLFNKVTRFNLLMVEPMVVGLSFVSPYLVPVFFGEEFLACIDILRIESIMFLAAGISQLAGTTLIALKKQNKYNIAMCTGAVVNILFNAVLIPKYKANGAAAATVVSEFVIVGIMLWFLKKNFEIKPIVLAFIRYLIPSAFMLIVLIIISRFAAGGVLSLIIMIAGGATAYGLALIIMREPALMEAFAKIKQVLKT